MSRLQTTVLTLTAMLAACRSSTSTIPRSSPQPVVTPTGNRVIQGEWYLNPSYQPHTYRSVSQTIVRELSTSIPARDTIEQVIRYSVTLDPTGMQSTLSGHVDTVRFHHRGQVFGAEEVPALPLTLTGIINPAGVTLETESIPSTPADECNARVGVILNDIRRAIATYPTHLTSGLRWKDSTSTTTCISKEIPTSTKTLSTYQVIGESLYNNAERVILIQRLDSTHITGEGAQENHQIHLEGSSTGMAKIYIDPKTGLALAIEISQSSEISITSSGKRHHFSQDIIQKVELTD